MKGNLSKNPIEEDQPQVYAVRQDTGSLTFTRRDFLAASAALAGAAAAAGLSGCDSDEEQFASEQIISTEALGPTLSPSGKAQACKDIKAQWGEVNALAISPDGETLASGDYLGRIKLWSLPRGEFIACLIDLEKNKESVKGITYQQKDAAGRVTSYTLPCGSSIPAGAVCTCNCVAGGQRAPSCSCDSHTTGSGSHYWYPN